MGKILVENVLSALRVGKGKYTVKKSDIGIDGKTIAFVGEKPADFVPDTVINGENRLAIPGLINAHTHIYMSCLRGYADDLPFNEWLFERVSPAEDSLTPEDAYNSSLLGCAEAVKTGTTCFLDMHMFPGKVADAVNEIGMRAVLSRGLVGEGDNEAGRIRLAQAKKEAEDYAECPNLSFILGPHAIYTTDAEFLKIVALRAKEYNLPIHIHLSETEYEVSSCLEKHGMTPVEYVESLGLLDGITIAAHCVHVTDSDIEILKKHNVNVALCPRSNLKLGNGIAPVKKMLDAGINLCIGTDSAASNNTLDMFADMSFTALLQKGMTGDASAVTAGEVLDMATYNGAKALGINAGEIAVGKDADIVLLDITKPQFLPHHDLVSALCYSANGSETDTVFVRGEMILEHGKLTKTDEEKIYKISAEFAEKLKR